MTTPRPRLILGSSSPRRKELLEQIGVIPDVIIGPDINEDPHKGELPLPYVTRMALEKNAALHDKFPNDFIITADSSVIVGRRILGKPVDAMEAKKFVTLLSGRSHVVVTGVAVRAPDGRIVSRLSKSRVKVARLSEDDIEAYIVTKEWDGKAGGYMFQGVFAKHIISINGSAPGIIGIPVYETMQMLKGLGYADRA